MVFKALNITTSIFVFKSQLRIMLLTGMKTSFITYPITPIIANPNAHEVAILIYSSTCIN